MICCQRDARTHRRQPTSVQYWWHFRAWSGLEGVPLGQLHSYSDHLAEHFGLLGMAENPNRSRRERMRLQDDFFPPHAAPRAGVTLASFYKVDRPSYSERHTPSTTRLRDSSTWIKLPGGRMGYIVKSSVPT